LARAGLVGLWAAGVQSAGAEVAGMGLARGDGGLLDLLGHPFALDLVSEAGECDSLALCAVSPVIGLAVGS
jgi:hypothetical protein